MTDLQEIREQTSIVADAILWEAVSHSKVSRQLRQRLNALQALCPHSGTRPFDPRVEQRCAVCGKPVERPIESDKWVTVAEPEPLRQSGVNWLNPTQNALVTVVSGQAAEALFGISGPLMEAYAKRLGVDFLVIDEHTGGSIHPDWPMSCKYNLARALDHYERIAYVDADVLLRPGCPDLFKVCQPDELGVVDELEDHLHRPSLGVLPGYQRIREGMGFEKRRVFPFYFNCGVMVVPRKYQHLVMPPTKPILVHQLSEQNHTNALALDSGANIRLIDRRCNWMHWIDTGFNYAPDNAILHFAGMSGDARLSLMRKFAEPFTKKD